MHLTTEGGTLSIEKNKGRSPKVLNDLGIVPSFFVLGKSNRSLVNGSGEPPPVTAEERNTAKVQDFCP
jgi:hypothetical protein